MRKVDEVGMIAIDMEMPQNCEQCRFSILQCDDVYCTAMTDTTLLYEDDWHLKRVDRCPLRKLANPKDYIIPFEEKELQSDSYYTSEGQKFHLSCPFCGHRWWEERPFPPFCQKCGKDITHQATIGWKEMVHPDEEAMAKRDDFLSDENGERLNKAFQSLWGDD